MKRYTWSELNVRFQGEWVELVDFAWDEDSDHPRWASVRHHAPTQRELRAKALGSEAFEGAVTLYISGSKSVVSHSESAVLT